MVVCDGFTGNMLLKMYEGVALALMDKFKGVFTKNTKTSFAAAVVYKDMKALKSSSTTTSMAARRSLAARSLSLRCTAARRRRH